MSEHAEVTQEHIRLLQRILDAADLTWAQKAQLLADYASKVRLDEARLWDQFRRFLAPHDPGGWTQTRVAELERSAKL